MTPEELIIKIAVLEKRMDIAQGQNEILLSFTAKKFSKEDLMQHLKFVSESNQFSEEAKDVADEMLYQDKMWSNLSPSEPN